MMRDILDTLAELSLRDWLDIAAQFAGMCAGIFSIGLICIMFAPL